VSSRIRPASLLHQARMAVMATQQLCAAEHPARAGRPRAPTRAAVLVQVGRPRKVRAQAARKVVPRPHAQRQVRHRAAACARGTASAQARALAPAQLCRPPRRTSGRRAPCAISSLTGSALPLGTGSPPGAGAGAGARCPHRRRAAHRAAAAPPARRRRRPPATRTSGRCPHRPTRRPHPPLASSHPPAPAGLTVEVHGRKR